MMAQVAVYNRRLEARGVSLIGDKDVIVAGRSAVSVIKPLKACACSKFKVQCSPGYVPDVPVVSIVPLVCSRRLRAKVTR